MGIECKVCLSEKREYIEQLILQGNSNLTISATLKDMSEDISHASIGRHKTKHMPDYADTIKENAGEKGNRKYDREDSKNAFAINASGIYEEIRQQALHAINYDDLAETNTMVRLMLNRVLNNQMAITIDMQEKYMQGKAKYPNEQIRGLQIIQDMAQKFEDFARKNFSHYRHIVDSSNGIMEHITELGKKAKLEVELKTPYVKGTIFLIAKEDEDIDKYYDIYCPTCPYTNEKLYGQNKKFDAFNTGIKLGMSEVEKMDFLIWDMLSNNWGVNRALEKTGSKLLNRYIKKEYEADTEFNKLLTIIEKFNHPKDYES